MFFWHSFIKLKVELSYLIKKFKQMMMQNLYQSNLKYFMKNVILL